MLDGFPAGARTEAGSCLSLQADKVRGELQQHRPCFQTQAGIVHCCKFAQLVSKLVGCERLRLRGRLLELLLAPAVPVSLEPELYLVSQ